MEVEDPNQKTKKIHHSQNPTDLNQRQENEKSNTEIQKTKKRHHSLNPTDLNQGE